MKTKIATSLILSASLLGYFSVNQNEFKPQSIDFNGQVIEMTHTDNNDNEYLIIYTDKATYSSWDTAEVIFSVTNLSNKNQNVKTRLLYGKDEVTGNIQEYIPDVAYVVDIPVYGDKTLQCKKLKQGVKIRNIQYYDCDNEVVYFNTVENNACYQKDVLLETKQETRYRDVWLDTNITEGRKDSHIDKQRAIGKEIDTKYKTDKESNIYLSKGETKYFKASIKFTPLSETTEFYIEAIGDEGSYGILDPWYSGSWTNRKKIEINPNYVTGSADLTNFPVLIEFTDSDLSSKAQADGDDILFTSSDETTKIDHEIEKYTSATGQLISWVEVPTLSYNATTTLYMYYGNSGASNQQNATGVWDSNYQGVYHLADSAANTNITDSTSNARTLINNNNTDTDTVTAKINGGMNYNAGAEKAMGSMPNITSAITISAWVKPSAVASNYLVAGYREQSTPTTDEKELAITSSAKPEFYIYDGTVNKVTGATSLTAGTWYYMVGWHDSASSGNKLRVFLNGVQDGANASGGSSYTYSTPNFEINGTTGNYFAQTADFDEVRVSNIARSPDWITTEYNNQSATSTFYIKGAEENAPASGGGGESYLLIFE